MELLLRLPPEGVTPPHLPGEVAAEVIPPPGRRLGARSSPLPPRRASANCLGRPPSASESWPSSCSPRRRVGPVGTRGDGGRAGAPDEMSSWNVGPKNGFWKGGRSVASNGYVLIRVGLKHHLADVRGYAYEHRLVAEKILGRRLRRGEQVHHKDKNKANNKPSNLEIHKDQHSHFFEHRKRESGKRAPGEKNRIIACRCGCGGRLKKFDYQGRPRRFIYPHHCRLGLRRGGPLVRG